ncbi:MAG: polymorphic toxin type 50 domain-containing protein [Defluviitaleaceae bacterium]|nr:polymorphic toxin type 50 domain-containing protein [Defluviitaleaceae bacterium]
MIIAPLVPKLAPKAKKAADIAFGFLRINFRFNSSNTMTLADRLIATANGAVIVGGAGEMTREEELAMIAEMKAAGEIVVDQETGKYVLSDMDSTIDNVAEQMRALARMQNVAHGMRRASQFDALREQQNQALDTPTAPREFPIIGTPVTLPNQRRIIDTPATPRQNEIISTPANTQEQPVILGTPAHQLEQSNILSYTIHQGQQDKHIEGTKNYNQQIANGKQPSILREDPATLLEESLNMEGVYHPPKAVFDFERVIGEFWDVTTESFHETTRATIHYNSKGQVHIVPAKPNELLNREY